MTSRGRKIWRWAAGTLAALVILAALAVGALRLALGLLPEYEARIAETVRAATGLRLSFDALDARLGRYGPEIFFEGARIVGPDGSDIIVSARSGRASLAPLRSLYYRRLEIARIVLDAPRLNLVIFPDHHVELVGQSWLAQPEAAAPRGRGLERIPRGRIEIRDASVGFLDLRAGRAAFELTAVDVELQRSGDAISVSGRVRLPGHLGTALQYEADVAGDLADFRSLAWRARLIGRDVQFAGWRDLLPETFALPLAGDGSFRISARGRGGHLEAGRAVLQLADVTLPPTAEATASRYTRLAGDIELQRDERGWHLRGERVEVSLAGAPWSPTSLAADLRIEGGRLAEARAAADFIRLENLVPFVRLAPPSPARDHLLELAPRGIVRRADLRLAARGDEVLPDITGSAVLENIGFAAIGRAPGVDGLDGHVEGAGRQGVVTLATRDAVIDWPAQWREITPFARVNGRIEWSPGPGGVRLWADDLLVDAGTVQAGGRLRALLRRGAPALLDVSAYASVTDAATIARYVPRGRLKPRSLAWLDAAFVAGRVPEAYFEITGPSRGFPYRDGQGRFRATARAEGLTLLFAEGWQPLTELDATAHFAGAALSADAARGVVGGVAVRALEADTRDWRDSMMVVRGEAAGDAGALLSLLQQSPVGPKLGETFGRLSGAGPVTGEIAMFLPFKRFADRAITVRAVADGVSLRLDGVGEPLTELRGGLWFRNREVHAPALTGAFLGGPLRARIATAAAPSGELVTTVEADGILEGARLPAVVRLPLDSGLAGNTRWRGTWTALRPAEPEADTRARVRLDSDLDGLASGLPAPFGKAAEGRRALRLEADIDGAGTILARIGLGAELRGLVEFRRGEDRYALHRGLLRFGGGEASTLPADPGLRVEGRLPFLSVSDLTALRWERPAARPLEDQLAAVSLEVGRLEALGYEFERVSASLRPGDGFWDVEVAAPSVQGRLEVPFRIPGDVPLVADLQRLAVTERVREGGAERDPRELPALRLDVRDLTWGDRRLGRLRAEANRVSGGLRFESLLIEHPAFAVQGSGGWLMADGGPRTALAFELSSRDVRALLEALAFAPLIDAREGRMTADLNWPGGPDEDVPARASGSVRLSMAKGRVVSVDPGAGRILGLMSVAHLPRRLALDFKDLTGQGMAFDTISGDFALASGDAFTDNLTLRGPAAEIGIAGRTSLRDRNYDQTAVVTGDVGGTLGVAGALAGGPAVGAALLLFSQIFKEPLKGVARGYYRITGPWEEPVVKKIDAAELGEAASLTQTPQAPAAGATGGAP